MRRRFINWARTVRSEPVVWVRPGSEGEVVDAVRRSVAAGTRLRPVGSAHSWSRIALPAEAALRLDRLTGIVSVDREASTVTCWGGTTLSSLTRELAAYGLSLPILGSIDAQTVAGAIGTATHGSSLVHGNLSSLVRGLRLVTGQGEILAIDGEDPRLDAARVHLGALGVVTQVTLQVVPRLRLREERRRVSFADAIANLEEIARAAPYVRVWWLPHTDGAWVTTWRPTSDPEGGYALSRAADLVAQNTAFPAMLRLGGVFPRVVPAVQAFTDRYVFRPHTAVGPVEKVLTMPMPVRHDETETAVPLEAAADVLRALRRRREGLTVDFVMEIRFVAPDSGWMSPTQGSEVCQIGAYAARSPDAGRWFAALHDVAEEAGGRPHWGKRWGVPARRIADRYPRLAEFAALASELDPGGIFCSDAMEGLLREGH